VRRRHLREAGYSAAADLYLQQNPASLSREPESLTQASQIR
jgi:hypothetical protein